MSNVKIENENEIMKNSLEEKHLGKVIENRLNFEACMKILCKRTGQKLHPLTRIADYMEIKKRCITNAFIM